MQLYVASRQYYSTNHANLGRCQHTKIRIFEKLFSQTRRKYGHLGLEHEILVCHGIACATKDGQRNQAVFNVRRIINLNMPIMTRLRLRRRRSVFLREDSRAKIGSGWQDFPTEVNRGQRDGAQHG